MGGECLVEGEGDLFRCDDFFLGILNFLSRSSFRPATSDSILSRLDDFLDFLKSSRILGGGGGAAVASGEVLVGLWRLGLRLLALDGDFLEVDSTMDSCSEAGFLDSRILASSAGSLLRFLGSRIFFSLM